MKKALIAIGLAMTARLFGRLAPPTHISSTAEASPAQRAVMARTAQQIAFEHRGLRPPIKDKTWNKSK